MAIKKEALEMIDEIEKQVKGQDTEKTKISKRGRKSTGAKAPKLSPDECTEKIYQLFNLPFKILGKRIVYQKSDFKQEGETLCRIANKYPTISSIILLFDPIYLIGSLLEKLNTTIKANPKQQKPKTPNAQI